MTARERAEALAKLLWCLKEPGVPCEPAEIEGREGRVRIIRRVKGETSRQHLLDIAEDDSDEFVELLVWLANNGPALVSDLKDRLAAERSIWERAAEVADEYGCNEPGCDIHEPQIIARRLRALAASEPGKEERR